MLLFSAVLGEWIGRVAPRGTGGTGTELPLAYLREQVAAETSEAEMLRGWLDKHGALSSVVNRQCELWRG